MWTRANLLWMTVLALFVPLLAKAEETTASDSSLQNPIGSDSIPVIIGNVVRAGFGIVGSLALLMFIYGGFVWLTSGGKAESIKKGRDTMIWAALGIAVMFAAYALTSFILSTIGSPATTP